MPKLAGSFSKKDRLAYVERSFVPGAVLYLSCPFTTPPKPKYVIIAAAGSSPLLIVINSNINEFIKGQPRRICCQVRIDLSDHSFLQHDSYADCSDIRYSMSEQEIVGQLVDDPSRIKGTLSPSCCAAVVAAVRSAHTVAPLHVAHIEQALSRASG